MTVTFTAIVAAETSTQVYGDILFSNPAMVVDPSVVQVPILSFGVIPWVLGTNPCSSTVCTIMNQIGGLSPMPVSNSPLVIAILTFTAGAVGTLNMSWDPATFDFFGAVNQPGASITVVPEPTTSALLAPTK